MSTERPSSSRLLTPILIGGILIFAGLVAFISVSALNREQENVKDYTHARMKSLILDLETELMSIESAMITESHRTHVALEDSLLVFSYLEHFVRDQKYVENATLDIWETDDVYTNSKTLFVSKGQDGTFNRFIADIPDTKCDSVLLACIYEAYDSEKPVWSHPYYDNNLAHSCVVTCYERVKNKWAMFGTDVKLSSLLRTIDSLQFYEGSRMYIVTPNDDTYTLEDGELVRTDEIDIDEKRFIAIMAHYRRLDIGIINVVPKEKIYNSLWNKIFLVFLLFVVALTLIALHVHRSFRRAQEELANSIKKEEEEKLALKRIEDEISIAARIQNKMLLSPGQMVHFESPHEEDLQGQVPSSVDLMTEMIPAREVGGDLYEYRAEGNNLVVCVGDVSGKGVPAAIVMAKCCTLFHAFELDAADFNPSDMLRYMNVQLCRRNEEMMFVTMWIGVLDMNTGQLKYSSAGHNPPVLVHDETSEFLELCQGVPLGMFEDAKYPMCDCSLAPDDTLLLYTDGITEAEGPKHALFGDERLLEVCRSVQSHSPKDVCQTVLQSVSRHTMGCRQSDDITLLCFTWNKA